MSPCVQAKGFEMTYLEKVPEVKDTVHKQSLLHHACSVVVENFPQSTDLYSEIGAITRSAKVRLALSNRIFIYELPLCSVVDLVCSLTILVDSLWGKEVDSNPHCLWRDLAPEKCMLGNLPLWKSCFLVNSYSSSFQSAVDLACLRAGVTKKTAPTLSFMKIKMPFSCLEGFLCFVFDASF